MYRGPSTSDNSTIAHPGGADVFPALQFDPDEFMDFVKDENLSDEQARALLEAIWNIVVAFVDLGYGVGPFRQAVDGSGPGDENKVRLPVALLGFREEFSHSAMGATATGRTDRGAD